MTLTERGTALIGLLAAAKLGSGIKGGWVTARDIASLPEWTSARRRDESLHAEIRREIKSLIESGIDIVEWPRRARLKGPFRLKVRPILSVREAASLPTWRGSHPAIPVQTAERLLAWLEAAEPVWRMGFYFDKKGGGDIPTSNSDVAQAETEPLAAAMLSIDVARRMRDRKYFKRSQNALHLARQFIVRETNQHVKHYLEAAHQSQQAWLLFRQGRKHFPAAERQIASALAFIDDNGGGLLRIRGQLLSLRSLLHQHNSRFDDATIDLWQASQYWLVELDHYNLFSVFTNLSTLFLRMAKAENDAGRRDSLMRRAIGAALSNENYCHRYDVGQNSIDTKILLVSLYTTTQQWEHAATWAQNAFLESEQRKNTADMIWAHYHRVKIALLRGWHRQAAQLQQTFLMTLQNGKTRDMVKGVYARALSKAGTLMRVPARDAQE